MKKTIVVLAIAGGLCSFNLTAQNSKKQSTAERKAQASVEKMSQSLDLTPSQKKAIYERTVTFHQQQESIQVTLDTTSIEQQSKQIEANNIAYKIAINNLLNEQQKQQWQQAKEHAKQQSKQKTGLR